MKQYPSISGHVVDVDIFATVKNDGSGLRCEWTRKTGFSKFGSRKVLLDKDHPFLGTGIALFNETYSEPLAKVFHDNRLEKTTCYFEFFGHKSFAGLHETDDTHEVVLFDIDVYKRGLLPPQDFLKLVGDIKHADVLYTGKPNADFIKSVRESTLVGMPFEGVVCKGQPLKKGFLPTMFKLKSEAWLRKVKELNLKSNQLLEEFSR